ncbi:kinase domain protein (macronuclear) [Tetrahymena thermophila SB210]|uniref:Kinase domain protein n=1 Tax=Tetrahymena thermophila (strain SB210) TaxID=312017 RepID=I7LTS4_TETTS|nr:kinase domain protein [Tetrahymena thermophila SB210]EAR86058.2 kinase domain protein [Tetrahymena thermophila SB210]|eukprot:XP_976653.2 kinase domain protein [Tetrahymena thermophila SB210]
MQTQQMNFFKAGNYKMFGSLEHNKKNECQEIINNQLLDYIFFSDSMIAENCCIKKNKINRFISEIHSIQNDQYEQIHNFYRADNGYLLILNKNTHRNLHNYLEQNKFPANKVCFAKIIVSILQGLINIHQKSIIYTCISPYNLKLDAKDKVIFKENTYERIFQDYTSNEQQKLFLAPEILERKQYGFQADLYSFGVLLFYMIYNRHPFYFSQNLQKINKQELIDNIKQQKINFDQNIVVPICLIDFIKRLLHYDPQKRMSWYQVYRHPFLRHYIEQLNDSQFSSSYNIQEEENLRNQKDKLLTQQNLYQKEIFQENKIPNIELYQQNLQTISLENNKKQQNIIQQKRNEQQPKQQADIAQKNLDAIFDKAEFLSKFTKSVKELQKKIQIDSTFIVQYSLIWQAIHILNQIQSIISKQNTVNNFQVQYLDQLIQDENKVQSFQMKVQEKINKLNKKQIKILGNNQAIKNLFHPTTFQTEYNQNLTKYINTVKTRLEQHFETDDKPRLFAHIMLAFEALNIQKNNQQDKKYFKEIYINSKNQPLDQWEKLINQKLQN